METKILAYGGLNTAIGLSWIEVDATSPKQYSQVIKKLLKALDSPPSHVITQALQHNRGSVGLAPMREFPKKCYSLVALLDLYASSKQIRTWQALITIEGSLWYAASEDGIILSSSDVLLPEVQAKELCADNREILKSPPTIFVSADSGEGEFNTTQIIDLDFIVSSLDKRLKQRALIVKTKDLIGGKAPARIAGILFAGSLAYLGIQWWQHKQEQEEQLAVEQQVHMREMSNQHRQSLTPQEEKPQWIVNLPAKKFITACDNQWFPGMSSIPGWKLSESICSTDGLHLTWTLEAAKPEDFSTLPALVNGVQLIKGGDSATLFRAIPQVTEDRSKEQPLMEQVAIKLIKSKALSIAATSISIQDDQPARSMPQNSNDGDQPLSTARFKKLKIVIKAKVPASLAVDVFSDIPTLSIDKYDPSNLNTDMSGNVYVQ